MTRLVVLIQLTNTVLNFDWGGNIANTRKVCSLAAWLLWLPSVHSSDHYEQFPSKLTGFCNKTIEVVLERIPENSC